MTFASVFVVAEVFISSDNLCLALQVYFYAPLEELASHSRIRKMIFPHRKITKALILRVMERLKNDSKRAVEDWKMRLVLLIW